MARALAAVAGAFVAGWCALLAWGNAPPGRALLRDRAGSAIRARVGPAEIGDARLDPLLRVRLYRVTVRRGDGTGALATADRVVVRVRLASLLAGRVDPAAVALRGLRMSGTGSGAEPGYAIGPVDVFLELQGRDAVRGRATFGGGGHLDFSMGRTPDALALEASGGFTVPDDLPPGAADLLPFHPYARVSVRASGTASGTSSPEALRATGRIEVTAAELTLAGSRVGPEPLGPLDLRLSGEVGWDGRSRRLALSAGKATLGEAGDVAAALEGEATLRGDRRFRLALRAGPFPWSSLVAALPPALGPPPTAPRVTGNLAARAAVSGSLARRGEWEVQVELDVDDLRRAARSAPAPWLASGFSWTPIDPGPGESPRRIDVGPGNPDFVPYAETPQLLVRAVTASEDAGFFGHRGFDFREIANAVADRSRVRGASTISQQLAKNLFLSPERTLARKVREALGTIALEASLPKWRLMEIYLNIAEWGPGVYGAGEASRFWFGKDVRQLSAREAAFLATVIPSPRRFHARLHRSGITPWWNARIDDVLGKMRVQGQLDDARLAAALAERLEPLARVHPVGDGSPVEPVGDEADEARDDGGPYLSR